jgi:membrane-bound ClpP family serine protease
MIFAQEGVRRGVAVRSESGEPIEQGAEVVVTRYEGGIAYVRTWEEMQKL